MRLAIALVAFMACCSAARGSPQLAQLRDGAWLQNGIRQYQRANDHESLSEKEAAEALAVTSYVCAVVDLEKDLARRAALLSGALQEGKSMQRREEELLAGMARAVPILVPLLKTDFLKEAPSCDQVVVMVRDFLEKYPEMLPKDADAIVDRALLAVYTKSTDP